MSGKTITRADLCEAVCQKGRPSSSSGSITDEPQPDAYFTQMANAGPGLLLHDAVSASPFFEMDTLPAGQVTEAIASPWLQTRLHSPSHLSCLTTCRRLMLPDRPGPGAPCSPFAQLKQFAHSLVPNPIEFIAPAEDFQGIADLLFVRAVDSGFFRGIGPPVSLPKIAAYATRPPL
jgi:hypothetical protein